jgi:hypothetical protein
MVAYEDDEMARGDRGVVHPGAAPIRDTIVLTDKTKEFTAGTVLRKTATKDTYEAAAPADTLTPGSACILIEDSDGKNPEYQGLFGGMVVAGRLIDASGAEPVAAGDTLKAKLPALGIHLTQLFVGETK